MRKDHYSRNQNSRILGLKGISWLSVRYIPHPICTLEYPWIIESIICAVVMKIKWLIHVMYCLQSPSTSSPKLVVHNIWSNHLTTVDLICKMEDTNVQLLLLTVNYIYFTWHAAQSLLLSGFYTFIKAWRCGSRNSPNWI